MRVYLTGEVLVERDDRLVPQMALPGLQGRIVLALLAAEHRRPLAAAELAEELWGDALPAAWATGLRALISKLRAALAPVAPPNLPLITTDAGCYRFRLPPHGSLDVEQAHQAVHHAESDLRHGRLDAAGSQALVAAMITRRPFLIGADGVWVCQQRAWLLDLRLRALEVLAAVWYDKGDFGQAARDARAILQIDPPREAVHRQLILAHAAAGNRAAAMAAYQACRAVLEDELGVAPSPETEALYASLVRGDAPARRLPAISPGSSAIPVSRRRREPGVT